MLTIGVAVGLGLVVETLTGLDQVAPAAHGVLQLPVYTLLAICSGASPACCGPTSRIPGPMACRAFPRAP
jgi:hypothetical protein